MDGNATAHTGADNLTVLSGKRLAKRWNSDGSIDSYDKSAKWFKPRSKRVENIRELSTLLMELENNPQACVIRGQFVGAERAAQLINALDAKDATGRPDGHVPRRNDLFSDQALHSICFDVDSFSPRADPIAEPEAAVAEYIATLPAPFHDASFHWQLSSSAGHPTKTDGMLRAHVWFWLRNPATSAALKAWAKKIELPADHSLFQRVQIHYTAAPIFDSVADPVIRRSGFVQSEIDCVDIAIAEPEPRERTTADSVLSSPSVTLNELRSLLTRRDLSGYDQWFEALAIIHHETEGGDDGMALAIELSAPHWNAKGTSHFASCAEEIAAKWPSLGNSSNPKTVSSLRRGDVASRDEFDDVTAVPTDGDPWAEAREKERAAQAAQWTWTDLHEYANRAPAAWLIKNVLPLEEINMLYGASGAGKSVVAFSMALAIARGVKWRDWAVKHGPVMWLAAEGEGSIRNRYRAYCKANNLAYSDVQGFHVLGAGINLADSTLMESLALSAKSFRPVLIVVDTLAAASVGANENSGEDMGRVLDSCRLIHRVTGAAVLLVHHSGKSEDRGARGWSGIRAAVHAELSIAKRDDGLREVRITKMRDGTEGRVLAFKLRVVEVGRDEDGMPITSVVVEHCDAPATSSKKKPQGKWHKAIRESLADAGSLVDDELYRAALERVPEDKRTGYPRKRYREAREQMEVCKELRRAGDGRYEEAAALTSPDGMDLL